MNSGVYLIRSRVSGLCYVGQSSDIAKRWAQHRHHLSQGYKRGRANKRLLHSWHAHGAASFDFIVLERCAVESLTERENWWLRFFKAVRRAEVANSVGPVANPWRGQKHSKETLEKIAESIRGTTRTEAHREAISRYHKGRERSPEHCRKISEAKKGKPNLHIAGARNPSCRPERRQKMKEDNPARRPDVKAKIAAATRKAVIDVSSGRMWVSASACASDLGVTVQAVSRHLTGHTKSCAGRKLQYLKHH